MLRAPSVRPSGLLSSIRELKLPFGLEMFNGYDWYGRQLEVREVRLTGVVTEGPLADVIDRRIDTPA